MGSARAPRAAKEELRLLCSFRKAELPGTDIYLSTTALLHPCFRVQSVHNTAITSEDGLNLRVFDRKGAVGRPTWTVLLAGVARISAFGGHHWMSPGSMVGVAHKSAICMRCEGTPYQSLVLEWDPGTLSGELPSPVVEMKLDEPALKTFQEIGRLIREQSQGTTALTTSLLAALQRAGAPFDPAALASLPHNPPKSVAQLLQALDETLSSVGCRPTSIDLEERTKLSARQLNRLIDRYHRLYGFNAEGWRDTVNRRRIMLGAAMMTAPGATVNRVSAAMGFSSPEVFARALADAGMPPPSEIYAEVVRLGTLHRPPASTPELAGPPPVTLAR